MKLTVLVDNNTLIDRYYLGEPGVSYYIEEGENRVLFDVGYSEVFIDNAYQMGINLENVTHIVLSHGHNDHTWGLGHLVNRVMSQASEEKTGITLIAHPLALSPKMDGDENIGMMMKEQELSRHFDLSLSKKPVWISERLIFLGEVERVHSFENQTSIGTTIIDHTQENDYLWDDSALVYRSKDGLVIITGCSHAGICNIIDYAKRVCRDDRVLDIVGGFHLMNPTAEQLGNTLEYMRKLQPSRVHTCHCTDLYSKIALSKAVNIREVGVGLELEFD